MCFSETASFTAAAILLVQGLVSINLVKKHKHLFLIACIPLFFAIQQFSEGILWHYFNHDIKEAPTVAANFFLSIAFLVWPIVIPLSVFFAETIHWKKWLLGLFVLGGVLWAGYLISCIPYLKLTVTNSGQGILYDVDYFSDTQALIMKGIYLCLIIFPIFISSLHYVWIFGFVTLVSAVIAEYLYSTTFTSVWCFFGALLSLILYKILKENLNSVQERN
jgi:hypothetical protein